MEKSQKLLPPPYPCGSSFLLDQSRRNRALGLWTQKSKHPEDAPEQTVHELVMEVGDWPCACYGWWGCSMRDRALTAGCRRKETLGLVFCSTSPCRFSRTQPTEQLRLKEACKNCKSDSSPIVVIVISSKGCHMEMPSKQRQDKQEGILKNLEKF